MDELYKALIPLAVVLIGYLTTLLRGFVKSRTAPAQLATLAQSARSVVEAVDQLSKNAGASANAEAKRAAAESQLTAIAKRLGIKVTDEELNTFIESAVKAMNQESVLYQ